MSCTCRPWAALNAGTARVVVISLALIFGGAMTSADATDVTVITGTTAPTDASGAPDASICHSTFDPTTVSAATLSLCGIAAAHAVSTSVLPDGATEATYSDGSGTTFTAFAAPASFDPATASPAALAEYGFISPPSTASNALADAAYNAELDSGATVAPLPQTYFVYPGVRFDAKEPDWTGAEDDGGGVNDVFTEYNQPLSANCDGETGTDAIWAGIGGDNGDDNLVQAGTEQYGLPGSNNMLWWEDIQGGSGGPVGFGLQTAPGYINSVTVYNANDAGAYYIQMYDGYRNEWTPDIEPNNGHNANDSSSGEFIIEGGPQSSFGGYLRDYHYVTFQDAIANGGYFYQLPYEGIDMYDGSDRLANFSGPFPNGFFQDVWDGCN